MDETIELEVNDCQARLYEFYKAYHERPHGTLMAYSEPYYDVIRCLSKDTYYAYKDNKFMYKWNQRVYGYNDKTIKEYQKKQMALLYKEANWRTKLSMWRL